MPQSKSGSDMGARLRQLRDSQGWSLRHVAAKAGINHGYLSQLERGEVAEPAPSMLHKLATGYGLPFPVLMDWAGYLETGTGDVTPNQAIALSYLGEEISEEELDAVRAVLQAIRSHRATFGQLANSLDGSLSSENLKEIRSHVLRLLRKADALGVVPTPLEQVMDVAQLVAAGEITLDETEKRKLRKKFGSLVDLVFSKLQGVIHLRAREVWVQPDLYELKKRFVTAHEIGHDVLPWQRDIIAYLDDEGRLRPDVRVGYEREANQAAIELLAQGDALRREADHSALSMTLLSRLSAKYGVSMQATARRVAEETKRDAALAIRFRGRNGGVGPYHVYTSRTFGPRFGWAIAGLPAEARIATRDASASSAVASFSAVDLSGTVVEMAVEAANTPYAIIALYTPMAKRKSAHRLLRIG